MNKNIKDIAPLLAYHFVDIDLDPAKVENQEKMIETATKQLGGYQKYLLGLLHDSWVISSSTLPEKYTLTLNDFSTHVFADVIVEKQQLNIAHDKLVFPIQIDFETTNLTFNTVDYDGYIHRIAPVSFNEYLYEEIISVNDEAVELGLVVWKDGAKGKPGKHILILMSVKQITLTELQEQAWAEVFANNYQLHYKYFKSQFDAGRYVSDLSSCYELYEEIEKLSDGMGSNK